MVALGKAREPSDRSRPPAWSKWRWLIATTSTDSGSKPAFSRAATDPWALVGAHRPGLLVEPIADAGLDEDATRGRLDQQAVERLEEAVLVVDLVGDPAVPEQPGHRPEQRPGIGAEGAGLDERDARAASEVARPVDRVVQGCFSKSRWKAEAVGSFWPW